MATANGRGSQVPGENVNLIRRKEAGAPPLTSVGALAPEASMKIATKFLVCSFLVVSLASCSGMSGAAVFGDMQKTEALIQKGRDPNKIDNNGWSPLLWATYYNHFLIVNYLLENGADPNIRCLDGYWRIPMGSTPLIIAGYYGFVPIIRELLKHGANPDMQNDTGYTALMYAEEFKFTEAAKLLAGR